MKIWETNLRKLERRKQGTLHIEIPRILNWAHGHYQQSVEKSLRWNGRQIRNGCQAAAALAEHAAYGMDDFCHTPTHDSSQPVPRLEVDHFMRVDAAMREFHDYMTNVIGEDFSATAKMKGERDDEYEIQHRQHSGHHYPHSPGLGPTDHSFPPMRGGPYDSRYNQYNPQEQSHSRPMGDPGPPPFGGGQHDQRYNQYSPQDSSHTRPWRSSFGREQERPRGLF